jgi:chromate reductase, NAD(P)H dehydrogenase (quinone)
MGTFSLEGILGRDRVAEVIVARSILLVTGSLRQASTNTALLRSAARHAPPEVSCHLYEGLSGLPAFNPDTDRGSPPVEVERLRDWIHQADSILFSTPEYAGALPGSLKNLLDWTIGDDHPRSLYDKPVGWINASPRGAEGAHVELRTVLTYAHARIIEAACVHIPVTSGMVGNDGQVADDLAVASAVAALTALADASVPAV